jgi:hypothetical protein
MITRLPPQMVLPAELSVTLLDAAIKTMKATARITKDRRRGRRGQTLKPGIDTPLWNELSRAVRIRLQRYGEKARLGRLLGLPRQRVHELLMSRRHLPDAERTLLLLVWLHAREEGRALT